MAVLETQMLGATVGAEVLGVDPERLAADADLPGAVLEALEQYGALVFRGLHLDAAGLARQKWPESIHVVDELPRTPSGKVQKFVLRNALRDGALDTTR